MTGGPFGAAERAASAVPIRPGAPGEAPFWNRYAARFSFAPAFDFAPVPGAMRYRLEIASQRDSCVRSFESDVPRAPLSPSWESLPVGRFHLKLSGVSEDGESLGTAGAGDDARAAPFDGPSHQPVLPDERSGRLALERVLHKDVVEHWLTHGEPDAGYLYYRHPAKVFGALISGAVAHASLTVVQREHGGDYPTMFTTYPANVWIDDAIHPARIMIAFGRKLRAAEGPPAAR